MGTFKGAVWAATAALPEFAVEIRRSRRRRVLRDFVNRRKSSSTLAFAFTFSSRNFGNLSKREGAGP